jgi:hypothetical protein
MKLLKTKSKTTKVKEVETKKNKIKDITWFLEPRFDTKWCELLDHVIKQLPIK